MAKKVDFNLNVEGNADILEDKIALELNFESKDFRVSGDAVDFDDVVSALGSITKGFISGVSELVVQIADETFDDDDEKREAVEIFESAIIKSIVHNEMKAKSDDAFKKFAEKMGVDLND